MGEPFAKLLVARQWNQLGARTSVDAAVKADALGGLVGVGGHHVLVTDRIRRRLRGRRRVVEIELHGLLGVPLDLQDVYAGMIATDYVGTTIEPHAARSYAAPPAAGPIQQRVSRRISEESRGFVRRHRVCTRRTHLRRLSPVGLLVVVPRSACAKPLIEPKPEVRLVACSTRSDLTAAGRAMAAAPDVVELGVANPTLS